VNQGLYFSVKSNQVRFGHTSQKITINVIFYAYCMKIYFMMYSMILILYFAN
jgi:hypothetical protein